MIKWLKRLFEVPFDAMKNGDAVPCYKCGKECICGSVCPHCGFPSPGPSEIINKGF